jgi:DMSO/TMAO reductase YedYZ molybdopterin-dependent catalytic subunit
LDISRRRFIKWLVGIGIVAGASGAIINNLPDTAKNSVSNLLPPGQYQVFNMPVLNEGSIPSPDKTTWNLEVYGLVDKPLNLNYVEFRSIPTVVSISDFHCVTGWSKLGNTWEGVRFRDIMNMAVSQAAATYATFESENGFTTQLMVADLSKDDVLLAYRLEDSELSTEHGGPLRLVVPEKYGYKSAKWIRKIKFTDKLELGFWEKNGYSNTADPWKNDRYY